MEGNALPGTTTVIVAPLKKGIVDVARLADFAVTMKAVTPSPDTDDAPALMRPF